VAEVPLAHVGGAVARIIEQLGHYFHVRAEMDIVVKAAVLMRPSPRHYAGASGRADGLRIVAAVEDDALGSQLVPDRHTVTRVAVRGHRIGALLVGPKEEKIGLVTRRAFGAKDSGRGG